MTQSVALSDVFKALSDEVRLRILRALSVAELSVAEVVTVLGLPQSTVSRHLKPLRDTGLVDHRREGTSVYYRRGPAFGDASLAKIMDERLRDVPQDAEDRASVRRVLDLRKQKSKEFFERAAGSYGTLTEPGGGWEALSNAMAVGFAEEDVADLGAGEGALTLVLARFAASVVSVDHSPRMLRLIEERAVAAGVSDRVRVAEGDLESLPVADASVDAAFLSQALHHAARPDAAVAEAARILRPAGRLVILDLVRHEQEWLREQWADQWLGFEADEVRSWMESAGLAEIRLERLPGSMPELSVLLAVGVRGPGEPHSLPSGSAGASPSRAVHDREARDR